MPNVGPSQILLLGSLDSTQSVVTGVTTGTSIPIDRSLYGPNSIYLRSLGTTSGGTILIEEADWLPNEAPYSGTWSQIASISASTFTGSAQTAIHVSPTSSGFVRVRISSPITGGGTIVATLRSLGIS